MNTNTNNTQIFKIFTMLNQIRIFEKLFRVLCEDSGEGKDGEYHRPVENGRDRLVQNSALVHFTTEDEEGEGHG